MQTLSKPKTLARPQAEIFEGKAIQNLLDADYEVVVGERFTPERGVQRIVTITAVAPGPIEQQAQIDHIADLLAR